MAKLSDSLLSKLAGRKIETVKLSFDAIVDMIDEIFIKQASNTEELNEVEKTCSKHLLNALFSTNYTLKSHDERYELLVHVAAAGTIAGNYVWVRDTQTGQYFEMEKSKQLKALIKEVQNRVSKEKMYRSTGGNARNVENSLAQKSTQTSGLGDLQQLKDYLDQGIITQEEFDIKKKQILGL